MSLSPPDTYFTDYIENSRLLKPSTKRTYLNKIEVMTHKFFPNQVSIWWIMNHPQSFHAALIDYVKTIKPRVYQKTTAHTPSLYIRIVLCLFSHHRDLQEAIPEIYQQWKLMANEITQPLEDHYMSGAQTERQKRSMYSWEHLLTVRDHLPEGSIGRLIFSMYTMIPPLRCDFRNVRLYQNRPLVDVNNYIVLKDRKLVINDFKTSRFHPPIEIDLPEELMDQIRLSLHLNPREYLFTNRQGVPYKSQSTFNDWINGEVKTALQNPYFTLTMFRHIYDSQDSVKNAPMSQKRKIANEMGHSLQMQRNYQLSNENEEEDSEINHLRHH